MKKLYLMFTLFICFFVFSLKPSAAVVSYSEHYVSYKFNSKSVLNTVDSNFIGEKGYLEKLRNLSLLNSGSRLIFFTKNDIYVFNNNPIVYYNYTFNYEPSNSLTYVNLYLGRGDFSPIQYMRLSDFSSFDEFLPSVQLWDKYKTTTSNTFNLFYYSKHNCDYEFLDANYDYFTVCDSNPDNFNFIIPYAYINHTGEDKIKFNYINKPVSSTGTTLGYIYDVSLSNSGATYNTYYDSFGPIAKTQIVSPYLYSVAALVPKENYDNFKVTYDWYCDELPTYPRTSLHVYGKAYNGDDYYWEDIKYYTGSSTYYSPDYDEPVRQNGICSFSLKSGVYSNLDKYSAIYVDFGFTPSTVKNVRVVGHSVSNKNIKAIFNDVYQDYLIDEVEYSAETVYSFSTSDSVYNGYFFYKLLPKQYLPYLELGIYNYDTKSNVYAFNYTESQLSQSYIYSDLYRLNYGYFGSDEKTSLYFYINFYSDRNITGGLFSEVFVYNPVNTYVSVSEFNDLKTGFNTNYIDKDGNINNTFVSGDYSYDSGTTLGISSLFSTVVSGASSFVNCGIEILSLVTDFYFLLPFSVQSLLLLIFILGLLYIFIKMIM